MRFLLLYPEKRVVSDVTILGWANDAAADGDIDGGFGADIFEAIRQLENAGLITVGNHGNPLS